MIIRFWGSRGSIPVSGKEYIKYGGDTTCVELRTKNDDIIILDAGSGIRRLGIQLLKEQRFHYYQIFTHSHWDHILGFPFFKPIYFKKTLIEFYSCPSTQVSIRKMLRKTMSFPHFPVRFEDIVASFRYHQINGGKLKLAGLDVTTIPLSHPNRGFGYKFVENGKSFVFLTDNELTYCHRGGLKFEDYVRFCKGVDLLVHDAEYTDLEYQYTRTWGHSVYTDALKLALQAGVKQFGLFHHNQERTCDAVDGMVRRCRKIIRDQKSALKCFAVATGTTVKL